MTNAIVIDDPVEGAVVPRNVQSLELTWQDNTGNSAWAVFVAAGPAIRELKAKTPRLAINVSDYAATEGDTGIACTVCGVNAQGTITACSKKVTFVASKYALADSVQYRLVEPLFNAGQDSRIMRKNIAQPESRPAYEAKGVCIGCHAYSGNGLAAFNIRKGKDRRLVIVKNDPAGLRLFDNRKIGEFAFIAWSPDSGSLAIVANTFGTIDVRQDVIEPFNLMYQSGDIAIYDAASKRIKLLPGASEMDFTEDMPAWSPDGKELLYVKYHADKEQGIKNMGIHRLPFNKGEGGIAETVVTPSADGEYYYFPNYSPDGKWISFTKGNGSRGVFARRTSDIYIMPSSGGEAKKLSFNIDGIMDSWHRWSSDSRWLLFSSKRGGDMTALYLSAIDTAGNAAPPMRLAQHDEMKVNLPEFSRLNDSERIRPQSLSDIIENILSRM